MVIEKILRDYLADKLDIPVSVREPLKADDKYIVISKNAESSISRGINQAIISADVYDESLFKVENFAEEVIKAFISAVELPEISKTELNSSHVDNDLTKKKYRAEITIDIRFYQEY